MKKILFALTGLLLAQTAAANVIQTTGSGSAVTTINASADFENVGALNGNPYEEGGLSFSRSGLSFNNNGCDYAGCNGHLGFNGFSGNYMYGTGNNGSFSISSLGTSIMHGLEFMVGTGFYSSTASVSWQAYLNGTLVGNGSIASFGVGQVIGFASQTGFNELRYTDLGSFGAPAFDNVRAQLSPASAPVPAPSAVWLFGTGLVGLLGIKRYAAVAA